MVEHHPGVVVLRLVRSLAHFEPADPPRKHDDRREGRPDTREDRDARYEAHSRLTDALGVLVGLTTDARLLESARRLVDTSIAVGGLTTATHDAVRDQARIAHGAMLRAITQHNAGSRS